MLFDHGENQMDEDKPILKKVELPLHWTFPEDLVTRVAQNFTCQYTDGMYILGFFEVLQPFEVKGAVGRELKDRPPVEARCVARLAVPPDLMGKIAKVINEQIERVRNMEVTEKARDQKEGR